ncbi:hypothetical protein ACFVTY_05970 [Streptomyces sp. NPDC058067]|uniref:hypothetical protein n=1 Tax=Streptomyces sp. NPDC058067 TaxID=3346324 RepID=UPI0036EA016F
MAAGYGARPDATAEAFGARLADEPDPVTGGWLRTGDLGAFLHGETVRTGQLKEMMLVNGRNIYPHDVEATARAAHRALGTGIAFTVPAGPREREQLVLVVEAAGPDEAPDAQAAGGELVGAVQAAVAGEFGIAAGSVLLIAPGTVRRTTGRKIQRPLMRRQFPTGALPALHAVVEPEAERLVERAGTGTGPGTRTGVARSRGARPRTGRSAASRAAGRSAGGHPPVGTNRRVRPSRVLCEHPDSLADREQIVLPGRIHAPV